MNKLQFRAFRAALRKGNLSARVMHNGHLYSVSRHNVERLDSSGCYNRAPRAHHAMYMAHAGYMRRSAEYWAKRSAYTLISMARAYRQESRE